jgi:GntR family transcriptional regulator
VAAGYLRLRRVHFHDDEPYCLIEIYLAKDIFALDPEGFSGAPVIPRLAARSDVRIAQARQIMRITISDEETAARLDIGVGDRSRRLPRCRMRQAASCTTRIQYPAQMIQMDLDLMTAPARAKHPRPVASRPARDLKKKQ